MDLNSRLLELEETAFRLEQGVDAVWAVALAAECAGDGCAKGLHGVWEYLSDAQAQLRQQLDALHAMDCPEAEYFIEHMLPCYAQNLDELTRGRF